jgi:acyl-CoA reductase-like NAD-dependent aldehyde dehydrogenase
MTTLLHTTGLESSETQKCFDAQRHAFLADPYPPATVRRERLDSLEQAILKNQDSLARALDGDFGGRSRTEILFSEIFVALNSIRHARRHVARWMACRPREIGWQLQPARAYILPQPLGVIGIVAPWNYPIFLTAAPLAGALAAGNRAMIKPSEYTPRTSELLADIVAKAFPRDLVTVVNGDAAAAREFVSLPFDHLLFTGSSAVGRDVMRAASENLTPVTLELGGKSPAIITPDADLRRAAEDIAYAKLLNAGQICIAPDYVLVPSGRMQAFVESMHDAIERYYPSAASNPDYTAIINQRHYERLQRYIDEARSRGVKIVEIGPRNTGDRKMTPVLVLDPPDDLAAMRDEIFGPVLPVKPYGSIDEAIRYINQRPRPLALYLFARDQELIDRVLQRTFAGGVSINDTLLHIAAEDLPFGGVGPSGIGHYHGQAGFDTFSKLKPVFRRRWPGLGRLLRPPYGRVHDWLQRLLIGRD